MGRAIGHALNGHGDGVSDHTALPGFQRSQLLRCKPSGKFMLHPSVVQSENLEGLPGTEYKIRLDPYRAVLSVQFIERELLRRH